MLPRGCACMALILAAGSSVIRECIELNGSSYKGVKQISSSGQSCLHWLEISNAYNLSLGLSADPGEWNHSYCRNPDASGKPWCFVTAQEKGFERQDCILETCPVNTQPPNVHLALGKSVTVKPDPGLSRRPSKKNDPGALGYTLAALLMVIIIVPGTGIAVIYFYKKSLKLKMQQKQRAHDQEMHRLNLQQSAFCNAACDLTDESREQTDKEKASEKPTSTDEIEEDNNLGKDG
ncbi:phosphoinositide-3-kinase-interacting protein 1-like [Clarias gariepinus]|uniref:phosphoinositide-3-kinase-interacting protein 1-like n=1 Tax=Clarias gariepinus TaxID=13013 RepID=UPI00234DA0E3|nr:phosphoinositide-3-kinase-interacting protein 1-like [Clarias gariepinus]